MKNRIPPYCANGTAVRVEPNPYEDLLQEPLTLLGCDKHALRVEATFPLGPQNHSYRVVHEMPILLISKMVPPHIERACSLQVAETEGLSIRHLRAMTEKSTVFAEGSARPATLKCATGSYPNSSESIGTGVRLVTVSVDGFSSLIPQINNVHFLHWKYRLSFMLPTGCGD